MTRVGEIAAALAEFAPPHLAESWDNVGLLVGDPEQAVSAAVCCLDLGDAVLDEAQQFGAALVVAFHPPIFRPLARVTASDASSRAVHRAIRAGVSVYSTHTALDSVRPGTSDFLAEALGVRVTGVLRPAPSGSVKLVVFVPPEHVDAVASAMAAAGGGRIGAYSECSFRSAGQGSFRPLPGADPADGAVGELARVDEVRLEMLVPRARLALVCAAMVAAHPYQEVAHDVLPLENGGQGAGLGRMGELPEPMPLGEFAARAGQVCGALHLRRVGEASRPVRRVATMGGSGASLIADAARAGADVLVTGDVKHHDALLAQRLGLALVDPGHWCTERFVCERTAAWLRHRFEGLDARATAVDGEPFSR